jgi:hypothetical protein
MLLAQKRGLAEEFEPCVRAWEGFVTQRSRWLASIGARDVQSQGFETGIGSHPPDPDMRAIEKKNRKAEAAYMDLLRKIGGEWSAANLALRRAFHDEGLNKEQFEAAINGLKRLADLNLPVEAI